MNQSHIIQNISIEDFDLTESEMSAISSLNCNYKTDWDPYEVA